MATLSPLKDLLATKTAVEEVSVRSERNRLQRKITEGQALLKNLWGIEASHKEALQKSLTELKAVEKEVELHARLRGKYHRLSLEPLRKWRNKQGRPQLVVFSLESDRFALSVRYRDSWSSQMQTSVHPTLPPAIRACYSDVAKKLRRQAQSTRRGMTLSCTFSGLIPLEVKERVAKARADFGDRIFLIAEVTEWKLTKAAVKPKDDPLIVGVDEQGGMWLIADFDTTSVEDQMFLTDVDEKGDA